MPRARRGSGRGGTAAGDGRGILRAGVKPAPGAQVVLLLALMEKAEPDVLGGLSGDASDGSILEKWGWRARWA